MSPDKIFLTVNYARMSLAKLIENPAAATVVRVDNCPGLTALPELPAATVVRVDNCPGLTALPELPAATVVWVDNCPGLTALPELPAATDVWVDNCPGLTALPELPAATDVRVDNCPGLTALPELPVATDVWVDNCPGLTAAYAGKDSRGYGFYCVKIRNQQRVIAGCRNFSFEDARKHWGRGGQSDRPDCLALVEKLAAGECVAA